MQRRSFLYQTLARVCVFFLFFVALFGLLASSARAQSAGGAPDPVEYIVSPDAPAPGDLVLIEARGIGGFLGDATLTWQQNGKTIQKGVGLTTFSFTVGGLGSATTIKLLISSPSRGQFSKTFAFYPSSVHLAWEADTTAPVFFGGKKLYSAGSPLRVVAFPLVLSGGRTLTSDKLSFQWSRGGSLVTTASGLGRNVFSFDGDQLQTGESVSVTVLYGSTVVARADIAVPASDPQVALYQKDALRGAVTDRALPSTLQLTAKEISFAAIPYFFSKKSQRSGFLSYTWKVNNVETTGPESAQGVLTLRQTGDAEGVSFLSVALQSADTDTLTQSAGSSMQLVFGKSGASTLGAFFGL